MTAEKVIPDIAAALSAGNKPSKLEVSVNQVKRSIETGAAKTIVEATDCKDETVTQHMPALKNAVSIM